MPVDAGRRFVLARLPLIVHDLYRVQGVRLAILATTVLLFAWDVVRKSDAWVDFGLDAHAYWSVNAAEPYQLAVGQPDAFLYAPPFAFVFGLLRMLPWEVFRGLWLALCVVAVIWLAREWTPLVLALPPVFNELFYGNLNLLLAVAIVLGFRRPAAWAFILLTKVTPGVGILWFAVRREWWKLAIALGVTAVIVDASFLLAPEAWVDWIQALSTNSSAPLSATAYPIPLAPRLALAVVIVVWAALSRRRWLMPIAVLLAMPVIWSAGLSILVALIPLLRPAVARWLRPAAAARAMLAPKRGYPGAAPSGRPVARPSRTGGQPVDDRG